MRNISPIPSLRRFHICWLFARAGYGWSSIVNTMKTVPGLSPKPTMLRDLIRTEPGWKYARTLSEKCEYERRAYKALQIETDGAVEEHEPLCTDDVIAMGRKISRVEEKPILTMKDGTTREPDVFMGMRAPDPMATIKAAGKAGAGSEQVMREIADLFSADSLAVPNKMGFSLCPIPPGTKRLKKGDMYWNAISQSEVPAPADGVFLMGCFYDSSFIVPDRDSRSKAVTLAAKVLGISDKSQLDLMMGKIRALNMTLQIEHDEHMRRETLTREAELDRGKDVGGPVNKPGIVMTRPKEISAEEFTKKYKEATPGDNPRP